MTSELNYEFKIPIDYYQIYAISKSQKCIIIDFYVSKLNIYLNLLCEAE